MTSFIIADDNNFKSCVLESRSAVMVEFGGEFCKPCKTLEPMLLQLGEAWQGKVSLVKVAVEEQPDLAQRYMVFSVPTVILFKGGEERARQTGLQSMDRLKKTFEPFL
jgi:thioredoxin 1